MPWYLWLILFALTFVAGLLGAPRIRVWINGAETEIANLRDRARALETKLRG
jgi:hypothetical protein